MTRHVVIIGGGFGGLRAARALRRADVRVTVIDRRNHHLFQPLLYQVATAALAPGDIAEPIRSVLHRQRNTDVRLGEVTGIDLDRRQVLVGDEALAYDWLVVAAGATHSYFGHDEWAAHAPGLKTVGDALEIRRKVLAAFERAEWTEDPDERRRLLTFVVVGAGPTGVELAGAIAEIGTRTVAREFHHVSAAEVRVVLVEAGPAVLGAYDAPLPERARRQLEALGVVVRTGVGVTAVDEAGVRLGDEALPAATVIWAAGVAASGLGRMLGPVDRAGRVEVEPGLTVPGHPEVFVIGDMARATGSDGKPIPGDAPAAIAMGRHAARCIQADLRGRPRPPFTYRHRGSMATIGTSKAVAQVGPLKLAGFVAWVIWVFVHLMTLVSHRNRVVVFVKWAWIWLTYDYASRLVYQEDGAPAGKDG